MKLETGMYVRTKNGLIAKYIGFEKDEQNNEYNKYKFNGKIYWYYEYYNDYVYEEDFEEWFEENVIKASNNIIDLIEEGDIIVDDFTLQPKKVSKVSLNDDYIYCNCDMEKISPECIKSIVTKEQFESMQYKVD